MDYSRFFKYKHEPSENGSKTDNSMVNDEIPQLHDKRRIKSLMLVLIVGLLIIVYVSNVIQVKNLLKDVYKLRKQSEKIIDGNQMLKAKINMLESAERITTIAREKFLMVKPDNPPVNLPQSIDSAK